MTKKPPKPPRGSPPEVGTKFRWVGEMARGVYQRPAVVTATDRTGVHWRFQYEKPEHAPRRRCLLSMWLKHTETEP